MKHAIVIAALLALAGCTAEIEVATPGTPAEKWEQLGAKFYKYKDNQNRAVCYMFYPGSATSASLSCIKE